MLEQWESRLDTVKGDLEIDMNKDTKRFKITTSKGHYSIALEVQKKESGEIVLLKKKKV